MLGQTRRLYSKFVCAQLVLLLCILVCSGVWRCSCGIFKRKTTLGFWLIEADSSGS